MGLVLDEFCEFQVGPRLKITAHRVKKDTDPSWARIVLRVVLAWAGKNQMPQAPVLEIEPIMDLHLFDFFCVSENHCLHETPLDSKPNPKFVGSLHHGDTHPLGHYLKSIKYLIKKCNHPGIPTLPINMKDDWPQSEATNIP
jgi:hypothetical protein